MIEVARRSFLTGLGAALIAAPAIVRAGSLMPVRSLKPDWKHLVYHGDGMPISYMGYDLNFDGRFPLADLLDRRIEAAHQVLARNLRASLDTLVYDEGSGSSCLAALFDA